MASLNKVMVIGNLGRDPEIRAIPSGAKVANFSIATSESYNDKSGQRVEKTEWHRIVMWRGLADIAERFLRKGSQVYIEGKLQTRSWDDQSGQKRYITEIVADSMQMLGGRPGGSQGSQGGDQNDSYGGQSQGSSYGDSPGYGSPGYGSAGGSGGSGGGGGSYGGGRESVPPPPPEDDLPF